MATYDSYNNFRGTFLGADRLASTTPSPDASDALQPFLPCSYPAPWLPIKRRDESHPIAAGKVLSEGNLVGVDQSGALIPAGYLSGPQANGATKVVTSVTVTSGVATLSVVNAFKTGETVNVAGFSGPDAIFNGAQVVTAHTGAGFSFASAHADEVPTTEAGLGVTATSALAGKYCVVAYSQYDVGCVYNPQTGLFVQVAGERVVIACPADAAVGDLVTLPNGSVITVSANDITFALACTLIPGGKAKALGYAIADVFVYLGGVNILSTVGGLSYILLTQRPDLMQITNYMHSAGTAIKTHFVLRMPWIGATPSTLQQLAATDGLVGYTQTDFSRSFVHFTGAKGNTVGTFFLGCSVVPSTAGFGTDAGNYAPFDPLQGDASDICGRVLGVELMYPIRDYVDRVRTQFGRASEFLGPRMDPNPVTFGMGGSATKGMDFAISLGTNGIFPKVVHQGKPQHGEYSTYVLVHVNCR